VNPDNIVEKFGYYARRGDLNEGLERLLENDKWRIKGELGYKYAIRDIFKVRS